MGNREDSIHNTKRYTIKLYSIHNTVYIASDVADGSDVVCN